ncbi:hypothetical protein ACIPX0_38300 [Streptomyces sp. NPDC090075]|uniref:hypothetical protein n=1 Tax=Streptomyces sp. NPDC090075 TaxID=3365937 RepID=UPI00380BB175
MPEQQPCQTRHIIAKANTLTSFTVDVWGNPVTLDDRSYFDLTREDVQAYECENCGLELRNWPEAKEHLLEAQLALMA